MAHCKDIEQVNRSKQPISSLSISESHDYLNRCRKGLWHYLTSPCDKSLEETRNRTKDPPSSQSNPTQKEQCCKYHNVQFQSHPSKCEGGSSIQPRTLRKERASTSVKLFHPPCCPCPHLQPSIPWLIAMFLTTIKSLLSVHLDSWPTLVSTCLTHLSGSLTKRNLSLCCFCDLSPSQDMRKWPTTQMDSAGHQRYSQSLGASLQNSVLSFSPACCRN